MTAVKIKDILLVIEVFEQSQRSNLLSGEVSFVVVVVVTTVDVDAVVLYLLCCRVLYRKTNGMNGLVATACFGD